MTAPTNETPTGEVIYSKPTGEHVEVNEKSSSGDPVTALEVYIPDEKINRQTILAFLALSSQFNAYILTLLIPSTILSTINADLGPDPNYTWITVSWTLSASIIVSVGGRLSDIFGRRYFMLTGSVFGLIGVIIGATGHSINQMIVSGIVVGFGSGFQESVFACVQEIVPNKHRVAALGLFEISCIPAFLGPIIAAAFINTSVGWRGAYYYMVAFHFCGLVMLFFTYHPPSFHTKHSEDGKTKMQLVKEMDFIGLLLGISGCVLFLLGVNWGGRQYQWQSGPVIGTMIAGFVCLIALGFWEVYAPLEYPLMPPRLFRKTRKFTMVLVVCFVGGMLYYSLNVLWPRQSGLLFAGSDNIIKGVYSNMIPFGTIIASFIVTFFCAKVGHERWQLFGFIVVETALVGSLASIDLGSKAQAIATVILLSSMVTPPNILAFTMLSLGIDDQTDIGIAVGLAGTIRLLGGAIATSIYTAIVNNGFTAALPSKLASETANLNVPASSLSALLTAASLNTAAAYKAVPGITAQIIAAAGLANQKAYVSAFRTCYLVAIAFGVVAMVAAFLTKDIERALKTGERAVRLENEEKGLKVVDGEV